MSISIDELTNSLSASHVGQEAIDLAALQAQLAQTLFGQSIARSSSPQNVSRKTSFTQPCNTPTFSNFAHLTESQGTASAPSSWPFETSRDDMEDERMVEDILVPRSPSASALQYSLSSWSKSHYTSNNQTSDFSSFTTTDPFYLAQYQAQHQKTTTPTYSAFAELGKLPQQSPFSPSSPRRDSNSSASSLALETHSFFVTASAAFEH
ncbi:hypothetical protein H0H87_004211 [Tephrocybe sp. NHM501043]|nr:hypothetical protein H0H87_004211 [Tephrocybe sp. NHM501043]